MSIKTMAVVMVLGLSLAGCAEVPTSHPSHSAAGTSATTPSGPDLSSYGRLPPTPATPSKAVTCVYDRGGTAARAAALPGTHAEAIGTVRVAVDTDRGPLELTLNRAQSPCTVNSFLSLAAQHFFDGTACHRLSTGALRILQCGDPTGTGRGGPGYTFANEYPTTTYAIDNPAARLPVVYPRGTVAMANTGTPGTNGSQFFLVYGDSPLPPLFTVFGALEHPGLTILDQIAAAGHNGSTAAGGGKPKHSPHIRNVSITR